ncbi:hypothetical protein FBUS_06557 [Fasciolopsis buskii]|uniref:Uncharacterized protein n=1 Tax=Fasciolopsis buskii TaxID=27845 RepID=A0A8E0RZI1_9TREM|nr:hypothetical protein FBUS_06557 [Fasciolopsis buski]
MNTVTSRVEVVMASPGLQRSVSKPRISSSSSSSNTSRAFYEPPPDRQTAAQIVRESREWLQAVSTRRPYTPRNQPRSLFGPSYKPISSKPSRNVKVHQGVTSSTSSKPFSLLDVGYPVQIQPHGGGNSIRKITSGEVYTGSLKHLAEPNSLGKTKLELIGKQTKLLSPNQPRLLTPALTQMGAQFVPSSMASREKAFGQRTRMTIAGAKKHEAKSGDLNVRRSPVVASNTTLSSASTLPIESPYSSPVSSDLDSGVDLRVMSTSQLSSPQRSDNLDMSEERPITMGVNHLEGMVGLTVASKQAPVPASDTVQVSSKLTQSVNKPGLTSPSGDLETRSVSELGQLIAKLNNLSHFVQCPGSPESELGVDASNRTSQSSESSDSYDITTPEEQEAVALVNRINETIEESGLAGEMKWSDRSMLLHTAFGLLDWPSAGFRLALIKLILTIQVTGQSLTTVCELLYKISKQAKNDVLFLEHSSIVDCLMHTLQQLDTPLPMSKDKPNLSMDPMLDNVDAILFFTGTLKFLAASPVVSDTLYNHPAFVIGLLSLHQQVDRRIRLGSKKSPTEPIAKFELEDLEERLYLILVQVNPHQAITCSRSSAKHLTQFNWIRLLARLTEYTEVCLRLDSWSGDELYNSISSVDDYCADLVQASSATRLKHERSDTSRMATLCNFLFSLLSAYSEDLELTVRVAYLLGNLTARLDSARKILFPNPAALSNMCDLCRTYHRTATQPAGASFSGSNLSKAWSDIPDQLNELQSSTVPQNQSCLEVVNKLVRVLANSAIGETVGRLAVVSTESLDLFLDLIACESPREPTELLLNCLAGLNNITYYIHPESPVAVLAKQYNVAEFLIRTLGSGAPHPDVILGVIRIFGNLTRQSTVRNWISQQAGQLLLNASQSAGVIEPPTPWPSTVPSEQAMLYILIQNLDSARPDLVYSTLGVLINLMTDMDQRPAFKKLGGISK